MCATGLLSLAGQCLGGWEGCMADTVLSGLLLIQWHQCLQRVLSCVEAGGAAACEGVTVPAERPSCPGTGGGTGLGEDFSP